MTAAAPSGPPPVTTLVVLLAAGAGTRFAAPGHKLLGELRLGDDPGEPTTVFGWALHHAAAAAVGPIIVVTGAVDEAALRADPATAGLLDRPEIETIENPDWAAGQATSVGVAIRVARARGAASVVVGLADQPFVAATAWRTVAAESGPIAVATYDGVRGNPVRLSADVWDLLPRTGDEGARALMRDRPELVTGVPCTGSPADIDTVEDLHRWQNN